MCKVETFVIFFSDLHADFSVSATDLAAVGRGEGGRGGLHRLSQEGQVPQAHQEHIFGKSHRLLNLKTHPIASATTLDVSVTIKGKKKKTVC